MDKKFQKTKMFIIFLILICSSLYIICPIGKSGPLDQIYECKTDLIIEYNQSLLEEPIIPFSEPRSIPILVKARIFGPAADIVLDKIGGNGKIKLNVDLSIDEVPEGCQASITPPIVQFPISGEFVAENATISITVNKDLPAASQKNVVVRMYLRRESNLKNLLTEVNITQEIPFVVGYYPKLSFVYIDGNVRDINPDETASFNFQIQNWGNGVTDVISDIVDLPEGWEAEMASSTVLGSEIVGGASNQTISLKVKPPVDFGYHEDRAIIKVSMVPKSKINYNDTGEPLYLYFIVQSRGFYAPGFEIIILFFAFIFVLFITWKTKNKKTEKKQYRGK
jgi:hypothetical protein